MRSVLPVLFVAIISLIDPLDASPQSAGDSTVADPAWVYFRRAELLSHAAAGGEQDYARALRLYSRALELQPIYPEALIGIARIYRAEADLVLAETFYREALDQAAHLDVPDDEYALRLELARMYDQIGEERDYRTMLLSVVNRDPVFVGRDDNNQREAMLELLLRRGLDRVLVLYRLDFPQSLDAHLQYGRYLVQRGGQSDIDLAVEHLLFGVVEIASRAVEAIIERRFDYQFESVASFLQTADLHPEVAAYLQNHAFEATLRDLADVLDMSSLVGAEAAAAGIRRNLDEALSVRS
ncbi:MAG: hypothetical protein MI724_18540 [Spirochaetales bacterium]|nr:hypothetical protein [Spirochaetales bacterium]